ncbi:uncharacterized protein LOC142978672 [Anticarsia gemmatalis]|uniref:uncharacterized protein LOC142978672 n=1 Tax=Anticarsia gemmatalis TaxID=129554 RepID=UPI003F767E10
MIFGIVPLLFLVLETKGSLAPTHLLVTRVGPCYDEPQTVVSVSELSITTQTYDSSISGTLNVTEDIENGWKIKVTMLKCLDLRNPDSCDHFRSFFVVNNGCSDDDDEEQDIYGMLFHYVNPKLDCPIQAGTYQIVNYPFFTEDNYLTVYESKISTSVFGYLYRLEGYTADRRKILCLEAFLQLLYIREHDWVQNTDLQGTTSPIYANNDDTGAAVNEDDKSKENKEYGEEQ